MMTIGDGNRVLQSDYSPLGTGLHALYTVLHLSQTPKAESNIL